MFDFSTHTTHRARRKFVAVLMALVFVQGFTSVFLHLDVQQHFFCVEHVQFTHDGEHATEARQLTRDSDAVALPADSRDDRPDDDRDSGDQDCTWLAWMHGSSVAYPHLAPQLLNLPPPAELDSRSPTRQHSLAAFPVPIGHVSPINSPPIG